MPSGTLWAAENIKDANGNELYFAWGETRGYTSEQVGDGEGKRKFDGNDYEFRPYPYTKYNETDGDTVLEPEDDAATFNWGSNWRMPTKVEVEELMSGTTSTWTQVEGVNGMLFTSKANKNTLFFPAVGYAANGLWLVGESGYYFTASLYEPHAAGLAWYFSLSNDGGGIGSYYRTNGYSVRPVRK